MRRTVTMTILTCDRCQKEEGFTSNGHGFEPAGEISVEDRWSAWASYWPAVVGGVAWEQPPRNPLTICPACLTDSERSELAATADDIPF
jgi:hypothetical protein